MLTDSLRRWRDVFLYALIGLFAAPSVIHLGTILHTSLAFPDAGSSWEFSYSLGISALTCAIIFLRPRLAHFRYLFAFPPTFLAIPLAGLIAFVGAFLCGRISPTSAKPELLDAATAFAFSAGSLTGILFSYLIIHAKLSQLQKRARPSTLPPQDSLRFADLLKLDIPTLLRWTANEAPIESAAADMFGMQTRANRIVQALRRARPNSSGAMFPQTVVVQGPYGSGKSSLVRLVRKQAENSDDPRMIFVEFNCWGFESTTRAQEHVLAQCVEALHEVIDCTSLRSAPARYAQAISSAAPNWVAPFFSALVPPPSPREQIGRFAPLLRLSKAHLVAVVEDTDRNGGDFDPSQIEAMLYHFRSVERMAFIVTAGPQVRIEFPKIAERIEFLPQLPKFIVLALIDRARDHGLTSQPFVDLVQRNDSHAVNRPKSLLSQAYTVDQAASAMNMRLDAWAEALSRLIVHPRQLKQFLNTFVNAWETLRGEVDIDELLIVFALRQAAPAAYVYLGVNLSDLRLIRAGNWSDSGKAERQKLIEELRVSWKRVVANAEFDVEAAEILLNELMPSTGNLFGPKYYNHGNRIQSLVYGNGPDYWGRMTSEALNPHEIRDQEALHLIANVGTSVEHLQKLVERVSESDSFASLLAFFEEHHRLLSDNAPAVLSAVHVRLREKFGASANGEVKFYQLIKYPLSRSFYHVDTVIKPWLEKEIVACFPKHLRLASDLYDFYARRTSFASEVRTVIHQQVEHHFSEKSGREFALGFDPGFPWTLSHLLFADGDDSAESLMARPSDWQFLVPVILGGMQDAPDVMIPAALFAFCDGKPGPGMPLTHAEFRQHLTEEFFGENIAEFYKMASSYDPKSSLVPVNHRRRLEFSIEAAKKMRIAGDEVNLD